MQIDGFYFENGYLFFVPNRLNWKEFKNLCLTELKENLQPIEEPLRVQPQKQRILMFDRK